MFYLMYFWYEQIHQSVDFNINLGELCVIISLKGKITVRAIVYISTLQTFKKADIFSQAIFSKVLQNT